tara:strand:+ start:724 stop:1812 length:1089 start_codon:yes stop_codon:yes gene_type:complete
MNLERLYNQIIDPNRKVIHEPFFRVLNAVSFFHSALMRLRSRGYSAGWLSSKKLDCRVVSIGNLTLGGTGKTPMTLWLARMLRSRGHRPAILSRGYKGTTQGSTNVVCDGQNVLLSPESAGDEPVMLASRLKDVPVLVGANRYSSALFASQHFDSDVLLLDDGYQHLALRRDCNILLLDCANPFGNGLVFPSGHLREPIEAIERADVICFTRCSEEGSFSTGDFPLKLSKPSVKTRPRLSAWVRLDTGERLPPEGLCGESVLAFCGIARPEDFQRLLDKAGVRTVSKFDFSDHHFYSKKDLNLMQRGLGKARCIATTEKDAVKIRLFSWDVPIFYAEIDLDVFEGEEFLIRSVLGSEEKVNL